MSFSVLSEVFCIVAALACRAVVQKLANTWYSSYSITCMTFSALSDVFCIVSAVACTGLLIRRHSKLMHHDAHDLLGAFGCVLLHGVFRLLPVQHIRQMQCKLAI